MWKFFCCMQNSCTRTAFVALVQNQKRRDFICTDPGKRIVTDRDMLVDMRVGCINRDEQKIRLSRHRQSGAERRDESMRQIPDETDSIGKHNLFAGREIRQTGFRIKRGKQSVIYIGIRTGQHIQEG